MNVSSQSRFSCRIVREKNDCRDEVVDLGTYDAQLGQSKAEYLSAGANAVRKLTKLDRVLRALMQLGENETNQ